MSYSSKEDSFKQLETGEFPKACRQIKLQTAGAGDTWLKDKLQISMSAWVGFFFF